MQTDINHYVKKDRINNTSFRQTLDPISKNILRRQNPLELLFEDISTFDAENPIIGCLLKEPDVGKKDVASKLIKNAPGPLGTDFVIRNRLIRLKDRLEFNNDNNNNNLSLAPSPPPSTVIFFTATTTTTTTSNDIFSTAIFITTATYFSIFSNTTTITATYLSIFSISNTTNVSINK